MPRKSRKPSEPAPRDFTGRLIQRLRTRPSAKGDVYVLDLRGREWEGIRPERSGFLTLRNGNDAGWPAKGRTTSDREIAEHWVRQHYTGWLQRRAQIAADGPDAQLTVAEACHNYIAAKEKELGVDHSTVCNRRSAFALHIVPAFGDVPLAALSRKQVREFLHGLHVAKRKHGKREVVPASRRTKEGLRTALLALWHHTYPDAGPPFGNISLADRGASRRRREAAESGEIQTMATERTYTREEINRLLAAAVKYDQDTLSRSNLSVFLLNTAATIALLICTAARIDELMMLRWKHVRLDDEAIFLPGTKSHNAARWIPLQRSLRPWLELLRELQGGECHPDAYVLHVRRGERFARSSRKTYGCRLAKVEIRAGLKVEKKETPIFRATHISWSATKISVEALKAYAGHSSRYGGATDAYVETRPPFMPPEHREYLTIPSPSEILQLVAGLTEEP